MGYAKDMEMIGPVTTAATGALHKAKLMPSGVELPGGTRRSQTSSLAAEVAGDAAPVDTARVATLKAAIADGRYAVDPPAIAERMIASDLGASSD